ncbi:hypothetical protein CONLIGDRAFT_642829 [Coniochaeta ligniaria NRRL 30616]|uniref:Protein kinase domain-containing protein n=1 Tax=Coniochaeta ligniaria NRRL 30616 TaxID=1408157 RepID=A0A1J7JSN8_9PEZI|nr:hypothetical protein CONLIGDRAFT_642829 [Coniochaeta ligniaria NRRL 30616]
MALCQTACRRLHRPNSPIHSITSLLFQDQRRKSFHSSRRFSSRAAKLGPRAQRPRSAPRSLPVAGFDATGRDQLVEEETMPEYRPGHFYPVCLGEVFKDRFQTVAKLGYGSSSTIWLARDLE